MLAADPASGQRSRPMPVLVGVRWSEEVRMSASGYCSAQSSTRREVQQAQQGV